MIFSHLPLVIHKRSALRATSESMGMSNNFGSAASARSALIVTATTYTSYAVWLFVSMVAARYLGPHDYGQYAFLVWLSGTLTLLFTNGLTISAIQFVSDAHGRNDEAGARSVHHLLWSWFLASLLVFSLLFLLASPWLQPAGWQHPAWAFSLAVLIAAVAKSDYTMGASFSKGYGRFDIDPRTINLISIDALVGLFVLVMTSAQLDAYVAYFVIVSIGYSIIARLLMRRAGIAPVAGTLEPDLLRRIRNHHLWTALLFLLLALSNKSVETIFLNSYVGSEAVGWFAIGAAMTRGGIDLLSSGLNSVLLPMMSHALGSKDIGRAGRIMTDAMRYLFFLGIVLAGVGVLWAAPAITTIYGENYSPAIIGLQVMMLVGALTMLEAATNAYLMTTDRQWLRVGLAASGWVITLAAAALFVPKFGFEGAIASHAISRSIIFVASIAIVARTSSINLPYADFARALAAGAVGTALAAGVLAVSSNLAAQFLAGAVYGLGCIGGSLLFGVWTSRDIGLLSQLARQLPWLSRALDGLKRRVRDA